MGRKLSRWTELKRRRKKDLAVRKHYIIGVNGEDVQEVELVEDGRGGLRRLDQPSGSQGPSNAETRVAEEKGGTFSPTAGTEAGLEERHAEAYFLLKSEPSDFSVDNLAEEPKSTACWDGVRNHQAKNILKTMKVQHQAFFYHSNCKQPGIVGIVEVVKEAYPDKTALDPSSKYHDPKCTEEKLPWVMVDVRLVRKLRRFIGLDELKKYGAAELQGMALLSRGRLSVQPLSKAQWDFILGLEETDPPE